MPYQDLKILKLLLGLIHLLDIVVFEVFLLLSALFENPLIDLLNLLVDLLDARVDLRSSLVVPVGVLVDVLLLFLWLLGLVLFVETIVLELSPLHICNNLL